MKNQKYHRFTANFNTCRAVEKLQVLKTPNLIYKASSYKNYCPPPKGDHLLNTDVDDEDDEDVEIDENDEDDEDDEDNEESKNNISTTIPFPPPDKLDKMLFSTEGALMPSMHSILSLNGNQLKSNWICDFYLRQAGRYHEWASETPSNLMLKYLNGARSPKKWKDYIKISAKSMNAIIQSDGFQRIKCIINEKRFGTRIPPSISNSNLTPANLSKLVELTLFILSYFIELIMNSFIQKEKERSPDECIEIESASIIVKFNSSTT